MKKKHNDFRKYNILSYWSEYAGIYLVLVILWLLAGIVFGVHGIHDFFGVSIITSFAALYLLHLGAFYRVVNYIVKEEPGINEKYGVKKGILYANFPAFAEEDIKKMAYSEVGEEFKRSFVFYRKLVYTFISICMLFTILSMFPWKESTRGFLNSHAFPRSNYTINQQ